MIINVIEPSVELITPKEHIQDAEKLLEKAGRTCYKSEDKITDESAKKFIGMLVNKGHESVIEHLNVTMKFIGDRSMSHQLVRHRLAAYSQESQRYCNYKKKGYTVIAPKELNIPPCQYEAGNTFITKVSSAWFGALNKAFTSYEELLNYLPAEDARSVLPNAMKTEVVATYNLRVWRHLFNHRALNNFAQWQIRELMQTALVILHKYIPTVFQDQYERLLEMKGSKYNEKQ